MKNSIAESPEHLDDTTQAVSRHMFCIFYAFVLYFGAFGHNRLPLSGFLPVWNSRFCRLENATRAYIDILGWAVNGWNFILGRTIPLTSTSHMKATVTCLLLWSEISRLGDENQLLTQWAKCNRLSQTNQTGSRGLDGTRVRHVPASHSPP